MSASINPEAAGPLLRSLAEGAVPIDAICAERERDLVLYARLSQASRVEKIKRLAGRGSHRAATHEARELRGSLPSRFLALRSSLPAGVRDRSNMSLEERRLRRTRRLQLLQSSLADLRDFSRPAVARIYAKPKRAWHEAEKPHHFRPIYLFDWRDKARQRLIAASLAPFVDFHPSQRLLQRTAVGRGRSAVLEEIRSVLPKLGSDTVFIQLDVRSFYSSVEHQWIEDNLPMQRSIVKAHVHTGGMMVLPMEERIRARLGDGALRDLGRRGLPQGSASSALVGEFVIASVLRGVTDRLDRPLHYGLRHHLHTYSDNLGVLVEKAQAAAITELLQEAFASSAAGPFTLTAAPPVPVTDYFKFLGYWVRLRDGRAEVTIPPDVAASRLLAITQFVLDGGPAEFATMERWIAAFVADNRHWNGVREWRAEALQLLDDARAGLCSHSSYEDHPIRLLACEGR